VLGAVTLDDWIRVEQLRSGTSLMPQVMGIEDTQGEEGRTTCADLIMIGTDPHDDDDDDYYYYGDDDDDDVYKCFLVQVIHYYMTGCHVAFLLEKIPSSDLLIVSCRYQYGLAVYYI
jgi:hypothetical protein